MNKVQLYIGDEQIELFKDETIDIVKAIQDVRDIAKVFTPFSYDFNVPASRTNNKIFSHYYNSDIQNGYDARSKVTARIELSSYLYEEGYIELSSVKMKDNKPYSYKIGFIGNTLTLKELFGKDKLSSLTSLSSHNRTYSFSDIQGRLQADPTSNDMICPLITHTDRLYYDSSITGATDGNLFYDFASKSQGVNYRQLKYALRVDEIIQAIETRYSITFSSDFFTSSNKPYYDLFLWLHKDKGDLLRLEQITKYYNSVNGFTNDSMTSAEMTDFETLDILDESALIDYTLDFNTASGLTYTINIYKDGVLYLTFPSLTGNTNLTASDLGTLYNASYTLEVVSTGTILFSSVVWYVDEDVDNITMTSTNWSSVATESFSVPQNMPDIEVESFLKGLFKMFNLTAYLEDGEVVVKTLDSFYSGGTSYDISKYVESKESTIGRALPYKEVYFKYKDTSSYLSASHSRLFGYEWGSEEYNSEEDNLVGSVYTIELPFSHFKYERIIDASTSTTTDIQWGYATDDNGASWVGAPLLFYPLLVTGGTAMALTQAPLNPSSFTSYNIPSNALALGSGTYTDNLNFRVEINEYTADSSFTGTLYSEYYSSYISSVFNSSNRMYDFTAYLPLRIINKLELNDTLVINGREFRINKYKINLQTGKTKLELLNL